MYTSRQKDIERLIIYHTRRLQKLEELRALEGRSTDPKTLIEIEDVEKEISELQLELRDIQSQANSVLQQETKEAEVRPPFKIIYDNRNENQPLIALEKVIGKGGEGLVYEIKNNPHLVAKIYHPGRLPPEEKLKLMLLNAPKNPTASIYHPSIAWITDLVKNNDGQFIGYVMPKIRDGIPIHNLYSPKYRKKNGLDFNWKNLHQTAYNLACVVDVIHAKGYVIGDLNESNIFVQPNTLITLLDTDSFQVKTPGGQIFRCNVGLAKYTAPEIQHMRFAEIDRTEEQDRFALAVLIFLLLMEGCHPFSGGGTVSSLADRIQQGLFLYGDRDILNVLSPNFSVPFASLHPKIQVRFLEAFVDGHSNPQYRPRAKDWISTFLEIENYFTQCDRNPNHFYMKTYGKCSWCERTVALSGYDPFPPQISSQTHPVETPEFVDNPEPRCPCVLLIDVSESMHGETIHQINLGLQEFQRAFAEDELASKRIEIATIAFGDKIQVIQDFSTADQLMIPKLSTYGKTRLIGTAIHKALDMIYDRKAAYRASGIMYYRPWMFLLTNGLPTDEWQTAATRIYQEETGKRVSFFPIGLSDDADFEFLSRISIRSPIKLRGLDFSDMFVWLSASLTTTSHSQIGETIPLQSPLGWGEA